MDDGDAIHVGQSLKSLEQRPRIRTSSGSAVGRKKFKTLHSKFDRLTHLVDSSGTPSHNLSVERVVHNGVFCVLKAVPDVVGDTAVRGADGEVDNRCYPSARSGDAP